MKTSEVTDNRVKKENKKALKPFLFIMLVSLIGGGCAGFGIGVLAKKEISLPDVLDGLSGVLVYVLPGVHLLAAVLAGVFCSFRLRKVKELYEGWDGEDEEIDEKMDRGMDSCIFTTNLVTILNMVFYMAEMHMLIEAELEKGIVPLLLLIGISVLFFGGCIWMIFVQKKVIDRVKQINPEKRGSVFDMKFAKKWEESCDEAEQYQIYKASFKAFQTGQMTCMICMFAGFLLDFAVGTGLLPMVMAAVIWMVTMASYTRAARKGAKR